MTGTCSDMVSTHLVKLCFSRNNRRCGLLGSSSLTAHLSDNLVGHFTAMFQHPTFFFFSSPCMHVSHVTYSEPSVGLLFALHSQHHSISIG